MAMKSSPRLMPAVALTQTATVSVAVGCLLVGFAANSLFSALIGVSALLTHVQLSALRANAGGLTAAMIPVALINLMLTAGALLWTDVADKAAVTADLPGDHRTLQSSLLIALVFTASLTAGSLALRASPARAKSARFTLDIPTAPPILFGWAVLALLVLGRGSALISAAHYLDSTGPTWAVILGSALAPVAVLALAFSAYQSAHGGTRIVSWVGILGWTVALFAMSTRQLALVPGLLLLGRSLAPNPGRSRPGIIRLLATGSATLVFAQLALTLRSTTGGIGLSPFIARILTTPSLLLEQLDPQQLFGNLLFAAPLTAHVAQAQLPPGSFWVSVDPAPGGLSGWTTISRQLRINDFTPFNGLGELAAHGVIYLVTYGLVVGLGLSMLSRIVSRMSNSLRIVGTILVIALATLFAVTMLQYNLRSATRLMWYAATAVVALRAVDLGRMRRAEAPPERTTTVGVGA